MTPKREAFIRTWLRLMEDKKYDSVIGELRDVGRELLKEVDSLRESIRIYGGHCGTCDDKAPHACACGFRQVYTKAITKKTDERTESTSNAAEKPGGVRGNP